MATANVMKKPQTRAEIDEYLFSRMPLETYSVSDTDVISFMDEDGREFDLLIDDEALHHACVARLRELGVRTVLSP